MSTWPGVKTYSASDKVSVVERNTFERDALNWLHDIPGARSEAAGGLGGGGLAVPPSAWTTLSLESVSYASTGMWDDQSPGRLTITEDGVYVITASILFTDQVSSGYHGVGIRKNDSEFLGRHMTYKPNTTPGPGATDTVIAQLETGDFIEMLAFTDYAGAGVTISTEVPHSLTVTRVRGDVSITYAASYTSPKTYSASEVLNAAADLNTYEASNLAYLFDASTCHAYHLTGLGAEPSISEASFTALAMNSEVFDTDTMHDTSTNNSRITVPESAVYLIEGRMEWFPSTTGRKYEVALRVNGTTYIGFQSSADNTSNSLESPMSVSRVDELAANDYVELIVYQEDISGSTSLGVTSAAGETPSLKVVRLRDG